MATDVWIVVDFVDVAVDQVPEAIAAIKDQGSLLRAAPTSDGPAQFKYPNLSATDFESRYREPLEELLGGFQARLTGWGEAPPETVGPG